MECRQKSAAAFRDVFIHGVDEIAFQSGGPVLSPEAKVVFERCVWTTWKCPCIFFAFA